MSETPGKRQTGPLGSRSLQAGGEFLKALASDLAAVASRLGRSLAEHRETPPSRPSAPSRIAQGPGIGRIFWRLGIALLGFISICAGAVAAGFLWVLLGSPPDPQRSDEDTLRPR